MTADIASDKLKKELGITVEVTYERLRFSDCIIDPAVQRPEDPTKLKNMVDDFDAGSLGRVEISRRANGANVILDGQHRFKAATLVGWDEPLDAKVYKGLTRAEEAKKFRILNNTTKASKIALFNVAIAEEDPIVLAVNSILTQYGLKAANSSFSAVGMALRIARRDNGIENFRWALDMAIRVWGNKKDSLDGRILEALAMVRGRYGFMIDSKIFADKLAKVPAGIDGLLGRARTYQQVKGGKIQTNLAEALVTIYNQWMKKNALEPWPR